MNRSSITLLGLALAASGTGCAASGPAPATDPASQPVLDPTRAAAMPCDPALGLPVAKEGCPDPEPLTGWVTSYAGSTITVQPFRTLGNGPAGRAYAESMGLEFPFPNDHHDATSGTEREVTLDADTVCTGVIRVGTGPSTGDGPLGDRVTPCTEFEEAVRSSSADSPVPAALWLDDGTVVQLSELYRP